MAGIPDKTSIGQEQLFRRNIPGLEPDQPRLDSGLIECIGHVAGNS